MRVNLARERGSRRDSRTMLLRAQQRSLSRPRPRPPSLCFPLLLSLPARIAPSSPPNSSLCLRNKRKKTHLKLFPSPQPTKTGRPSHPNRLSNHAGPRRRARRVGIHGRGSRPPRRGPPRPRPRRAHGRLAGRETLCRGVPAPGGGDKGPGPADEDRRRRLVGRRRRLLLPAARDDAGDAGEAAEKREDRRPERGLQAEGRRDL